MSMRRERKSDPSNFVSLQAGFPLRPGRRPPLSMFEFSDKQSACCYTAAACLAQSGRRRQNPGIINGSGEPHPQIRR